MSEWLVWSEEHGAWWRWGGMGYTRSIREAGRYTAEGAAEIVERANRYLPEDVFHEVALLAPARPDV